MQGTQTLLPKSRYAYRADLGLSEIARPDFNGSLSSGRVSRFDRFFTSPNTLSNIRWALSYEWVTDYKYLLSERVGRDIGVPATVAWMVCKANCLPSYSGSPSYSYRPDFLDMNVPTVPGMDCPEELTTRFVCDAKDHQAMYALTVEAYFAGIELSTCMDLWVMRSRERNSLEEMLPLSGKTVQDRLVHELQRWARECGCGYWANLGIVPGREREIVPKIIESYCTAHSLSKDAPATLERSLLFFRVL